MKQSKFLILGLLISGFIGSGLLTVASEPAIAGQGIRPMLIAKTGGCIKPKNIKKPSKKPLPSSVTST
ncbi:MAG: hypothetical protein ACFCU8_01570 [Thermosynechococcaceae cyanobacterium]